jgi:hypothetical protein
VSGERRLKFWRDRATHRFWVYKEEYARGDQPVIGTLYVSKDALLAMGDPEELEVSIKAA